MAMVPPPPPKDLPRRASPRHTPRRQPLTPQSVPVDIKLAGAADAVARLKAFRSALDDIQSTNLLAKRLLQDTDKVLKVGLDGGLDVQAMSFVVQRRRSVEETAKKDDDSHARMKEVTFIADQKKIAQSTPQLARSQQVLERALPAEQVAQSRRQFGYAGGNAQQQQQQWQTAQATAPSMLNPYSMAKTSNAAPKANANWQPTGVYNAAPSPYPGLNRATTNPAPYRPQPQMYPSEGNARPPAYGVLYPGVTRANTYPTEPQQNYNGFQAL